MNRKMTLAALSLLTFSCAAPPPVPDAPTKAPAPDVLRFASRDLVVRVTDTLGAGDAGALVADEGWREYRIELENRGRSPLTVHDVKVLTAEGRYLPSAATYGEVSAPPNTSDQVAGDVARTSAGIAAGQVIPYGGTIVGLVSNMLSASTLQSEADARRRFAQRRIKEIELAPGGRMSGSAFLPRIDDARALAIDYSVGSTKERVELPIR
jgi:hypothetical protein